MLDDSLFDDPGRLTETDTRSLLRSAALAGAQVRATSETAAEAGLGDLAEDRPRALVLLTRPGVAAAVNRTLAALLGPSCPVPVVVTESAPAWIGALDVVFAHTDDAGDGVLAESVALATRRGATVVLSAPQDGPVAAAAAGRAKLLPPRVPVPPELSFAGAFAAGLSVLTALRLTEADPAGLADGLDREAERCHPGQESLVNPAKALALRLADRTPLLWGLDPLSTAVAGHGAFALGCHAAVACDVAGYQQAAARHALFRAAAGNGTEADLFADPEDRPAGLLRAVLVSVRQNAEVEAVERGAVAALPGAELVVPGDAVPDVAALRAALLTLRFDLAAIYLGLAAGTLDGPGWHALAVH